MGEGKADVSAGNNCFNSSALRNPIGTSLILFDGGYWKTTPAMGKCV
jgi:hypothetical protein